MAQPPLPTLQAPISPAKRLRKHLFTVLKIAIAILGIWFVTRGVTWNDSAILPAGTEINTVKFLQDLRVRVLTPDEHPVIRIQFPSGPVLVEVNGQQQSVIIDLDTPVAGGGTLGLAREKDLPQSMLAEEKGQRIHQGLHTLAIRASGKWYLMLAAWAMLVIPFLVTAIRWRNLMRPQGIDMPLGKCIQLTFVGQFYSIMLPGITGGDLVKIVYASRLTGSKTKSFITIILDRVIGLVALMVIAGTSAGVQLLLNRRAGLASDNTLFNVFIMILAMLLALFVGTTIYFSRRLRRIVGIQWFVEHLGSASDSAEGHAKLERLFRFFNGLLLAAALLIAGILALLRFVLHSGWSQQNANAVSIGFAATAALALVAIVALLLHNLLVERIRPVMGKIALGILGVDETLHVYRGHFGLLTWAFIISLISQLTLPVSAWLSGTALGMNAPITYFMAYVPLAVLAASLPISPPQGLGFLEWVLDHFFVGRGTATASQAFALTQSVRFLPLLWNLVGAYWVITGQYSRTQDMQREPALDATNQG